MTRVSGLLFVLVVVLSFSEGVENLTELEWWETTLLYQIYPLSFRDSNGDGHGDLNGIYEKLDHLKEIGVDAVWIQPFYKSPMFDMGYDISDYKDVDPLFGTIDDFKRLQKAIKDKGMKLIVDFVPNHTRDQSEWFKLSEQRVEPYTDYYIWKNPKRINDTHTTVPNNWKSFFAWTAWTWSEKRKQYYFHQFSPQQPDLNFRNPKVKKEMEEVLRYWLDLGVDGFRVDAVICLYEAEHFMDEPPGFGWDSRTYTIEQPENVELIKEWRALLDEYSKKDGRSRLLSIENYGPPPKLLEYFGNKTHPGSHIPFYYFLTFAENEWNATVLDFFIHWQTDVLPRSSYNWVLDNHDNHRTSSRLFDESVDVWNMIVLLLPGLASVYYGTELGMEDLKLRRDQGQDHFNGGLGRVDRRDAYRGPMLWDDTENAGFTSGEKPWLPVHPNFWRTNVNAQKRDPKSHLNTFKRLAALRKTPIMTHGDFHTHVVRTWVHMFTRSLEDETIAVLVNMGSETEEICTKHVGCQIPGNMFVQTRSENSELNIGDKVFSNSKSSRCIHMRPYSGLVLSTSGAVSVYYSIFILLFAIFSNFIS
nr:PREDICTED: probable maltase [Bemisia tabaci]